MRPLVNLSSLSHSEKLENLKKEIKCVLIANSRERVTLEQLPNLFESLVGECIPFKDFNFCSLKDFLSSIPDAVTLSFDKKSSQTHVYPLESSKTKHISSLIARQRETKRKKLEHKPKLIPNYIDPILLKSLMLKLNTKKCIEKIHLLSEIQAALGVYSMYSIRDLNTQLNELSHILTHDESRIYLKSNHLLQDFIQQKTKDCLHELLTEKYPEGLWCEQLPHVYRKEYGMDLEYRNLGFNDIVEFIAAALPSHTFKCSRPPKSSKYRVARADMPFIDNTREIVQDNLLESRTLDPVPILPTLCTEVSKRLIPNDFMNFDDSLEQINVDTITDNSHVIVSEICNPSLFWIILHRNKRKLMKLMENLQEFYDHADRLNNYKIPPIVLKSGLHVACLYSKRWHRARIIKNNNINYIVQFYDYGTTRAYNAENLYFLHKNFCKLPAQAILSCLYNIKPSCSKEWTRVAIDKFTDETIEKDFIVSIHKRNPDNSITIDLIDTAMNLSTRQWMVSQNLATWGSTKRMINVNKISSGEGQEYTNYMRPAKQLEALQKYKKKFKLLELSLARESLEEPTCIDHESGAIHTKTSITEAYNELQKLIAFTKL